MKAGSKALRGAVKIRPPQSIGGGEFLSGRLCRMYLDIKKEGNPADMSVGPCSEHGQEVAFMFKIVRFPEKLEGFFRSLEGVFHWDHHQYFRTLTLLIAFGWGRRNIAALYRQLDPRGHRHRTRFNNFLHVARWDPESALQGKAYALLAILGPRAGEVIELVIDDSKKGKRGKKMEAVNWVYDPVAGRSIRGHQYVTAVLRFRGHVIPWGIRVYVKREDCRGLEWEFAKTTQLAAKLIEEFLPPEGVRVRVLFDSYYLCPTVMKACGRKGFHFVSTLKSNRNLWQGGRKLKVEPYGKNLFRRRRKQMFVIRKGNGPVRYRYVDAGRMQVSNLGELHVVFSRKAAERKVLGLVTDDPTLSAKGIIQAYDGRYGAIEVFFKDTKQLLGLGQYQNVPLRAAVTHLHLVCFAYALLTHIAITREGEKGKKRMRAARLSTGDLQNELRRIVWDDLVDYLKAFPTGTDVVKELDRLLVAKAA